MITIEALTHIFWPFKECSCTVPFVKDGISISRATAACFSPHNAANRWSALPQTFCHDEPDSCEQPWVSIIWHSLVSISIRISSGSKILFSALTFLKLFACLGNITTKCPVGRKKTAKLIKGCWWKRSFIWSTLKSTWVGRPHTSYLVDCEMNTKAIKGFDQRTCIWIQTTWRQKKDILRGSYPADPFSSHLLWSAQCIKLHDAAAHKIVKRSAARCYLKVHTSVAPTLGVTGIPGPGAERRMQPWSTHILALLSSDERQATLPPMYHSLLWHQTTLALPTR